MSILARSKCTFCGMDGAFFSLSSQTLVPPHSPLTGARAGNRACFPRRKPGSLGSLHPGSKLSPGGHRSREKAFHRVLPKRKLKGTLGQETVAFTVLFPKAKSKAQFEEGKCQDPGELQPRLANRACSLHCRSIFSDNVPPQSIP